MSTTEGYAERPMVVGEVAQPSLRRSRIEGEERNGGLFAVEARALVLHVLNVIPLQALSVDPLPFLSMRRLVLREDIGGQERGDGHHRVEVD